MRFEITSLFVAVGLFSVAQASPTPYTYVGCYAASNCNSACSSSQCSYLPGIVAGLDYCCTTS